MPHSPSNTRHAILACPRSIVPRRLRIWRDGDFQLRTAAICRCIHAQAVETLSFNDRLVFQFRTLSARAGSATNEGGSPARRGTILTGTFFPVTSSTV